MAHGNETLLIPMLRFDEHLDREGAKNFEVKPAAESQAHQPQLPRSAHRHARLRARAELFPGSYLNLRLGTTRMEAKPAMPLIRILLKIAACACLAGIVGLVGGIGY